MGKLKRRDDIFNKKKKRCQVGAEYHSLYCYTCDAVCNLQGWELYIKIKLYTYWTDITRSRDFWFCFVLFSYKLNSLADDLFWEREYLSRAFLYDFLFYVIFFSPQLNCFRFIFSYAMMQFDWIQTNVLMTD